MLDPILFLRLLGVVEAVGGAYQIPGDAADALELNALSDFASGYNSFDGHDAALLYYHSNFYF
jgi:hypothetical protein